MASLKIASLLLRTLSKPIATKIKQRAKDHEGFKSRTIRMAQFLHRAEMNLRVSLLGESPKHIRPLSESRAIESGANFLSEGFLFTVAATIIIGETYRSRVSESKRRDAVRDSLEQHETELASLRERFKDTDARFQLERDRNLELSSIVEQVVQIGLKGGFGGGDPLRSDESESEQSARSNWERHLRIAELARAFGTNGRVLREEDDAEHGEDEDDDPRHGILRKRRSSGELTDNARGDKEENGNKTTPSVKAGDTVADGSVDGASAACEPTTKSSSVHDDTSSGSVASRRDQLRSGADPKPSTPSTSEARISADETRKCGEEDPKE